MRSPVLLVVALAAIGALAAPPIRAGTLVGPGLRLDGPGASLNASYGDSVAIDGDTLAVGASNDDAAAANAGAVYIFDRVPNPADPNDWTFSVRITAPDAGADHDFGSAVSLWGDRLLVGDRADSSGTFAAGSAYLFERDLGGADNWGLRIKFNPVPASFFDRFGSGVAITDTRAFIGQERDDDLASDAGAVWIFGKDIGGIDNWGFLEKIYGDTQVDHRFGISLDANSDTLAVGADGNGAGDAVHVFKVSLGNYVLRARIALAMDDPDDDFGEDVDLADDGSHVLIGAPTGWGGLGGAYYVSLPAQGGFDPPILLACPMVAAGDECGNAVATGAGLLTVGAREDDDDGTDSGSVSLYDAETRDLLERVAELEASGGDRYGHALGMTRTGSHLLVGAELADNMTGVVGSAFVYAVPEPRLALLVWVALGCVGILRRASLLLSHSTLSG